jgi:hypothetical protein
MSIGLVELFVKVILKLLLGPAIVPGPFATVVPWAMLRIWTAMPSGYAAWVPLANGTAGAEMVGVGVLPSRMTGPLVPGTSMFVGVPVGVGSAAVGPTVGLPVAVELDEVEVALVPLTVAPDGFDEPPEQAVRASAATTTRPDTRRAELAVDDRKDLMRNRSSLRAS